MNYKNIFLLKSQSVSMWAEITTHETGIQRQTRRKISICNTNLKYQME